MRLKNVKGANDIIVKGIYYIDNPSIYKGKWNKLFNNNNPIYIELGMGKGDFIINNAIKYPNINFIGIEKYDSVIVRAIQKSNELELNNLKLIKPTFFLPTLLAKDPFLSWRGVGRVRKT